MMNTNSGRSEEYASIRERYYIECEDGWMDIIIPVIHFVEEYNAHLSDGECPIEFTEIKEKWGGLRIYTNYSIPELDDMIHDAEKNSWETCEFCGSKNDVGHTSGWILTLCRKCVEIYGENSPHIQFKWTPSDGGEVLNFKYGKIVNEEEDNQ